jgi:hypothetical protein
MLPRRSKLESIRPDVKGTSSEYRPLFVPYVDAIKHKASAPP